MSAMHLPPVDTRYKVSRESDTVINLIVVVFISVAVGLILAGAFSCSDLQCDTTNDHPFDAPAEHFAPSQPISGNASTALEEIKSDTIAEQRLNVAPEDGNRMHLSLLTPIYSDPLAETVKTWSISGHLAEVRSKTHWHEYKANNPLYIERLSSVVPPEHLPAVVLQNAAGKVLYMVSGVNIPASDTQLVTELRQAASNYQSSLIANQQPNGEGNGQHSPYCKPGRPCPQPQPVYPNTPYPNTPYPVQPSPGIDPAIQPNRLPWVKPVLPDRPLLNPVRPIIDGLQGSRNFVYVTMGFIVVIVLLVVVGLAFYSNSKRPW